MKRLIDADAFSEQYGNYYAEQGTEEGFIGTVGDLIDKQPTIEAEPVRNGRWINDELHGKYVCTCCNKGTWRGFGVFDFCPQCGAKMGGNK